MNRRPPAAGTRRRSATGVILVLMVAALLAGCGKKGNPSPPADKPSTYPQVYPKQ